MNPYERLENLQRIGIKLGLRNIRQILEKLGDPQKSWRSVLIAGTNGKGSVGAMLDAILRNHGLSTGHYTSPHLVELRERIRVNGSMIRDEEFASVLQSVFDAVDSCISEGKLEAPPTYFETLTAAAFLHFQRAGIEWGVIEVGLGGRFDATNSLQQDLSVITNIDFDHQEYLGHTLAEIAGEKAGILKKQVPLVTGILPDEAAGLIRIAAERQSCAMSALAPGMITDLHLENGFPVFGFEPWRQNLRISLRGAHQALNAGVAMLAVDGLRGIGAKLDRKLCLDALQTVRWPGRLELIPGTPPILMDCAHNPNGAESLAGFLEQSGWNRAVLLFTAMRDKNIPVMLSRIAPRADHVYLTRIEPKDRCARFEELAGACLTAKLPYTFTENCEKALQLARDDAAAKNLPLVIFGSIYLIGESLRLAGRAPA